MGYELAHDCFSHPDGSTEEARASTEGTAFGDPSPIHFPDHEVRDGADEAADTGTDWTLEDA
jgi:hypothetical protein